MSLIPPYIFRTATAAIVATVVVVPIIMKDYPRAGIVFGVAGLWMIANFIVWTMIMRSALKPKNEEENNAFVLLGALGAKIVFLVGGFLALRKFAPYTKQELLALIAGTSLIIIIASLRAIGAKISGSDARAKNNERVDTKV